MKKTAKHLLLLFALLLTCIVTLASCQDNDESSTKGNKTAEELLQAFKDENLNVIDEIIYTSETDPNSKLGRPGEYIAKINFNDGDFFEIGDTPDITIEVFKNTSDMKKRKDYVQDIVDSATMDAFKYYIYSNDVFLFRIPYAVTPEKAAEYEKVFNDYMKK